MRTYEKVITGILVFVLAVTLLGVYADKPCSLSFEVHKGQNFDQPYPTYSHCDTGIYNAVQTTDIHGNRLNN